MALKKCGLFHIRSALSLTMAAAAAVWSGERVAKRGVAVGEGEKKNPSSGSRGEGEAAGGFSLWRWAGPGLALRVVRETFKPTERKSSRTGGLL